MLADNTSKSYATHGTFIKALNGNSCMDVLKKLGELQSELEQKYPYLMVYVDALAAFGKVVDACFGDQLLDTYKDDIRFFKNMYLNLGLEHCVKSHILFDHVPLFCERRGAMGPWSEQAGFVYTYHIILKFFEQKKLPKTGYGLHSKSQQFRHLMRCAKHVNKICLSCLVPEIQLFVYIFGRNSKWPPHSGRPINRLIL